MSNEAKPKLLLLRCGRADLPPFVKMHLQEQALCLSQNFDLIVIDDHSCDYKQLCEMHQPDIAMFESGVYVRQKYVSNVSSCPTIPKIGFIHCDAYCPTRKNAIRDMARWEISTFFSNSVSLGSYTPSIADNLFAWPNFVNPELYRDYGFPKVVPILFSGSQAPDYPWRNKINRIVSQHYPTLHSPHFGWFWKDRTRSASSFMVGEKYAQLINSAWVAPSCGTIANEVVRKHFEIPACNTCLLTQRTATLEAAGFVDLVNCVFADDIDVLDKLEWLFQRPDDLGRIIRAGKQLVDSRHTIRQRNQIFQWYTLNRKLKRGQKIVQSGPFSPLAIVEENSGFNNGHVISGGIDRLLMNEADEEVQLGRLDNAENLYRKCLNYRSQDLPEPKLKLIRCLLHKGDFKAALASFREQFPSHRLSRHEYLEPDPTEWAWFIIVLLCCGKNREAALRADQFIAVSNEELHRVRCVVRVLSGQKSEIVSSMCHTSHRASVHAVPALSIEDWLEEVSRLFEVCGQIQSARMIATASSKHHARNELRPTDKQLVSKARQLRFGNAVFRYSFAAGNRLSRITKKITSRLERLTRRIRRVARYRSTQVAMHDWTTVVHLLQKEEIKSGILIGAANGSWFCDAFMCGMHDNPNMPSAVCVNHNTPSFRKFHRRFVDDARVEFRYLPDVRRVLLERIESADVITVHCTDLLKDVRFNTVNSTLVLLDRIDSKAGTELFQLMLSNENYFLEAHDSSQRNGYAVFRRHAVKAAQPEQRSAA